MHVHFWIRSSFCGIGRAWAHHGVAVGHSVECQMRIGKPVLGNNRNRHHGSSSASSPWSAATPAERTFIQLNMEVSGLCLILPYWSLAHSQRRVKCFGRSGYSPVHSRCCASWLCKTIWNQNGKRNSHLVHGTYKNAIENAWLHSMGTSHRCHRSFAFLISSRCCLLERAFDGNFEMNWKPVIFFCLAWRKGLSWRPWRYKFGWRKMSQL